MTDFHTASVTPKPHPALSPLQIDGGSIVDAARCKCYMTAIININWRSEGDRWTNDASEKSSICKCARERYVLTAGFRLAKENGLDLVCGPFGFFLKGPKGLSQWGVFLLQTGW